MNKKEDERKEKSKKEAAKEKFLPRFFSQGLKGKWRNCRIILGRDSRLEY